MRVANCLFTLCCLIVLSAIVPGYVFSTPAHPLAQHATRQRTAGTRRIPAPREIIGFAPGEDRKLASWASIVEYFKRLAATSDRIRFEELGKTTLGKPFVLATISSPSNLARLEHFKEIQRKLADPRTFNSNDAEAEKLIAGGRTIVLITCGIHSTEVGGNLVSMNIAHKLVSDDSAETREILDRCIVLLVPSLNPDGVDIVKTWYDKTIGTPAEGTSPPELYHYYTGHDNNRDWYAFTQVETQLTIDKVHNVWHPQIVHDIHQQGENGSRFFLPPYVEPWEPNVSPIIQAGVNFMGSTMAWELIGEGKAGVVTNGVYDAWSPARSYQHYHGGIRILSETASARIASPTNVSFEQLSPQIGVNPKVRSANFPLVWAGGEWKLSNIVDYMQSGAFALMRNAARYRERWLRDFYRIGKDAVRDRKPGELFALLIQPSGAIDFLSNEDKEKFSAAWTALQAKYPNQGNLGEEFKKEFRESIAPILARSDTWRSEGTQRLLTILKKGGVTVIRAASSFEAEGKMYPAGTNIIPMAQPYGAFAKTLLERQKYPDIREYPGGPPRRPYDVTAHTLPLMMGVSVTSVKTPFVIPKNTYSISDLWIEENYQRSTARVGVYKSYAASMDEGWTRWIFEQFKQKYVSLSDPDVRAGSLNSRFDAVVLPAQSSQQLFSGLSAERYPAAISGGLGNSGVEGLKKFVDDGGTLITLNEASQFAIDRLGVPVKNTLEGVPPKDFYCPGSILKIKVDTSSRLTRKAPLLESTSDESIAWVEGSLAFETTSPNAKAVARFSGANDLLLSGWLLGADKLANKAAIVEVKMGKGRVIMFAFRPQYRGQSIATLPFLFNAIETSVGK